MDLINQKNELLQQEKAQKLLEEEQKRKEFEILFGPQSGEATPSVIKGKEESKFEQTSEKLIDFIKEDQINPPESCEEN